MANDLSDTVLLLAREGMGSGPPDLQIRVLGIYLKLLADNGLSPGALCFYTDGVKLLVEGSAVLDALRALEARGVHLIGCKTCLDYFGLTDKVRVGIVGGMGDIQAAQVKAAKVIAL